MYAEPAFLRVVLLRQGTSITRTKDLYTMNSNTSRLFGNLETLESRALFSAAALADLGYAPINWKGQQTYAKPDEWIVQLNNVSGSESKQKKAINDRIGKGRHGLHASKIL